MLSVCPSPYRKVSTTYVTNQRERDHKRDKIDLNKNRLLSLNVIQEFWHGYYNFVTNWSIGVKGNRQLPHNRVPEHIVFLVIIESSCLFEYNSAAKRFDTMYIRNAQGQLMWIPPKGYTQPQSQPQPTQATLGILQQHMREEMQKDAWAQFNAPPPKDNVYFEDQFSRFEGSTVNGYHSVAPSCNSPTMANHGNMMYRGQQHPYNPPIPQVINPSQSRNPAQANGAPASFRKPDNYTPFPRFTSPRNPTQANGAPTAFRKPENSTPFPRFASPHNPAQANGVPATFRKPENSAPFPRFTSPRNPAQTNGAPRSFRNPENSSSSPMFTSPRNPAQTSVAPAPFQSPENPPPSPMFTSPRNPAQTNGVSVAFRSPENSSSLPMLGLELLNQTSVAPTSIRNPGNSSSLPMLGLGHTTQPSVAPASIRNPENASSLPMLGFGHPAQTNVAPIAAFGKVDESPRQSEIKFIEEEFVPETKISCMSTIFGSSIDLYRSKSPSKSRSKKIGLMNCDGLNVSISSDDETELGGDSLSYFSHSQKNEGVFQCNGIRGQGKKFDYFYESKPDSIDSETDSRSVASKNGDKEKFLDDSIDAWQMDTLRIPEGKPNNQEKTEHVKSPRSHCEESNDHKNASDCRETVGSYETMNAIVEDDSIEVAIVKDDSIEDRSDVIDHTSMTTEYAQHGGKEESNVSHGSSKFAEFIKRVEKPLPIHTDFVAYSQNKINTPNNAEHRRTVKILDEDSNENDKKLGSEFAAKDSPKSKKPIVIREEFPSFDEPDFPSFDEPAHYRADGDSDGENNQKNANICSGVEKTISTSKGDILKIAKETKVDMPLVNIAKETKANVPLGNSSVVN